MSKSLFDRLEGELEAREQRLGLKMSDLLTLPDALSCLLRWMLRSKKVSLSEIYAFLGQDETSARRLLDEVLSKGYIREIELHEGIFYRVRLAPKRGGKLPGNLWQALEGKCQDSEEGD